MLACRIMAGGIVFFTGLIAVSGSAFACDKRYPEQCEKNRSTSIISPLSRAADQPVRRVKSAAIKIDKNSALQNERPWADQADREIAKTPMTLISLVEQWQKPIPHPYQLIGRLPAAQIAYFIDWEATKPVAANLSEAISQQATLESESQEEINKIDLAAESPAVLSQDDLNELDLAALADAPNKTAGWRSWIAVMLGGMLISAMFAAYFASRLISDPPNQSSPTVARLLRKPSLS